MATTPQELCQRLLQQVSQLGQLPLLKVCQHLDLPGYGTIEGKEDSPKMLIRKISRHLLREELEEQEDEGMSAYQDLQNWLAELTAGVDPLSSAPQVSSPPPDQKPTDVTISPSPTNSLLHLTRREFKISGQIGEPGQRDRLTFSSLAHQIEHGRLKGHTEHEIVEGVIRAVVPGSALRSYLEGRVGLTLPKLRHILRSHYQEKDATELYHRLSRLAQDSKESAQSFLIRALDLKQKVIFASQEADSGLKYEPSLVQHMFLHALLTGFRSEAVRHELRPLLLDPKTPDEVLFEKANIAASHEMERQEKLRNKAISVHEVQSQPPTQEQKKKPKEGTLMTDITELKAGIAEIAILKQQISGLQETLTKKPQDQRQPRQVSRRQYTQRQGCPNCDRLGKGDQCDHCFKCGSSDHFARGCRTRRPRSGNDEGLLPRDGQ